MATAAKKTQGGDGSTLAAVLEKKDEQIPFEVMEEERLPGSRVRFKLKLTEQAIGGRLQETLKEVSRQVTLPGFRPGKAPQNLVRRAYEPYAREETVKRLVPRLSELFAGQKNLETLSQPYLLSWKSEPEAGTTVEIALEVHPDINLTEDMLKEFSVEIHEIRLDDQFVAKQLENLQAQNATYEPTEEGYQPKDGLLFSCVVSDEAGNVIQERSVSNYYSTKVEEEVPEQVAKALAGRKKGEHLSLDIDEESEFEPGKMEKVHYEFDVHEVKRRILPALDDEFAKDVNEAYNSLDDLKKGVAERAGKAEEGRQRDEAIAEIFGVLRSRLDFDLPRALVESTTNKSVSDMERRLNQYGLSLRNMDQDVVRNYAASMHEQARVNVKNYLIARAVAKLLNVAPTESDIQAALEGLASQSGRKALAVRAQLEARKQWDQFLQDLTIKVTNDRLLEKATVAKKSVTLAEFEEEQRRRQEEQAAKLRGEQLKAAEAAAAAES